MPSVVWSGHPPDAKMRALLDREGITLVPAPAPDAVAEIVSTASPAPGPSPTLAPTPTHAGPWLWLAGARPSAERTIAAVERGAYDVIAADEPQAGVQLACRVRELGISQPPVPPTELFVAESEAARAVLARIAHAARTSMPVLLTGETGTGKEIAARLLHEWSARRDRRFVPINCAAIPNELIEAELFGYAKGAFTGSIRSYGGQLGAAKGGTVFLDEVDDTPLPFQVKLLRVLEDRVVSRVGDSAAEVVDFRILAATNRDLGPLCASGAFGADLYERLAIVSIQLPPLRERLGDLPALVRHMVDRFYREEPAARARHQVRAPTDAALQALGAYLWPGNIRELRNVVFEALVGKRGGDELLLSDLPRRILRRPGAPAPAAAATTGDGAGGSGVDREAVRRLVEAGRFDLCRARDELERAALEAAVARAGGSAAGAARLLGRVGRGAARDPGGTVRAMIRRLGVGGIDGVDQPLPAPATAPAKRRRRSRRRR